MSDIKVLTWWDPACKEAAEVVKKAGGATLNLLRRKLGVSYCRANFLLEILLRTGVVTRPAKGRLTYKAAHK